MISYISISNHFVWTLFPDNMYNIGFMIIFILTLRSNVYKYSTEFNLEKRNFQHWTLSWVGEKSKWAHTLDKFKDMDFKIVISLGYLRVILTKRQTNFSFGVFWVNLSLFILVSLK